MICNLFPEPTFFLYSPDVPILLYYTHISTNLIALLVSFYAFWNNRQFLLNKLLLTVSICLSFWTFVNLIAWTNIHSGLIMFVWSYFGLILGLISISCIYLVYVFLEKRDVSNKIKVTFLALLSPIILFASTSFNLSGFNITVCDAFNFEWPPYKFYTGLLGVIAMVWIFVLIVRKYRIEKINFRKQIILMGVGIELFLLSFFSTEFIATYLTKIGVFPDSGLEIYGLLGMVIFMFFITVLIVRFNTFQVKVLGTQILLIAQGILVGSLLLIQNINYIRVVIALSLIVFLILGIIMVRGVKREIKAKDALVEITNLITHQIRGVFTVTKGGLSTAIEGSYGPVPPKLMEVLEHMFKSQVDGVKEVEAFLQAQKIESGTVQYDNKPFDLRAVVEKRFGQEKPRADSKGLQYEIQIDAGDYTIIGDQVYLAQVISNLIDNAIRYTEKGSIKVQLSKKTDSFLYSVKDSGVGIIDEDQKNMFEKYHHGVNSKKINPETTGLGLYIAKGIVIGHRGKIWFETEAGKGTTFFMELPISNRF